MASGRDEGRGQARRERPAGVGCPSGADEGDRRARVEGADLAEHEEDVRRHLDGGEPSRIRRVGGGEHRQSQLADPGERLVGSPDPFDDGRRHDVAEPPRGRALDGLVDRRRGETCRARRRRSPRPGSPCPSRTAAAARGSRPARDRPRRPGRPRRRAPGRRPPTASGPRRDRRHVRRPFRSTHAQRSRGRHAEHLSRPPPLRDADRRAGTRPPRRGARRGPPRHRPGPRSCGRRGADARYRDRWLAPGRPAGRPAARRRPTGGTRRARPGR